MGHDGRFEIVSARTRWREADVWDSENWSVYLTEGTLMDNAERSLKILFHSETTSASDLSGPVRPDETEACEPQSILRFDVGNSSQAASGEVGCEHAAQTSADSSPVSSEATRPAIPAGEVVESLIKAAHVLRGVLADHFAEFGLSDVRYTVMRLIQGSAATGCSQADLAEYLQQSESSVSTLIDRMRTDNLLYRLPSATDRRKKVLKLSDRGRELLAAIEACHEQRMQTLLDRIEWHPGQGFNTEICSLARQLTKLNQHGRLLHEIRQVQPAAVETHDPGEFYRRSA